MNKKKKQNGEVHDMSVLVANAYKVNFNDSEKKAINRNMEKIEEAKKNYESITVKQEEKLDKKMKFDDVYRKQSNNK